MLPSSHLHPFTPLQVAVLIVLPLQLIYPCLCMFDYSTHGTRLRPTLWLSHP